MAADLVFCWSAWPSVEKSFLFLDWLSRYYTRMHLTASLGGLGIYTPHPSFFSHRLQHKKHIPRSHLSSPHFLFVSFLEISCGLGWEGERLCNRKQEWAIPIPWAHVDFVKHSVKHLLLLEVNPPWWLGVARQAPKIVVWVVECLWRNRSCLRKGRDQDSEARKRVERDPTQVLPSPSIET